MKVVKSLKRFLVLPDYFENKMIELIDSIEGFRDTLVPTILNESKSIKDFATRRNEAITQINNMVKTRINNMYTIFFQDCISKLENSSIFYENFEKEVTHVTVKYNPYRQVADQIMNHN